MGREQTRNVQLGILCGEARHECPYGEAEADDGGQYDDDDKTTGCQLRCSYTPRLKECFESGQGASYRPMIATVNVLSKCKVGGLSGLDF
jgi:hypothetical protein